MNIAGPVEHLHQRIQAQIFARRHRVLTSGELRLVLFPIGPVVLGLSKALTNHFFHAHAGSRVTAFGRWPLAEDALRWLALALRVSAKREFNSGLRPLEDHFIGRLAPPQLNDNGLTANRIRTSMQ